MIRVLNRHKHDISKGIYIGRGTPLGNPFRVKPWGPYERGASIPHYRKWLKDRLRAKDPEVCGMMNRLWRVAKAGDLDLVCSCAPKACHGHVIREVLLEHL